MAPIQRGHGVGSLFRLLMNNPIVRPLLQPIVRPVTRLVVGLIAIPLFRLFMRNVVRLQKLDAELEKDFEQWFRGSLVLLVATRNMEEYLFPWVSAEYGATGEKYWIVLGLRLLLAIGVIESMPDQELFAIVHPGPPKLRLSREYGIWRELREQWWPILRGLACKHLNRSSPVFAILAAIADGYIGWTCYVLAVTQYLIIGLVTSRDKALDVLAEFDRQVALRRQELIEEFQMEEQVAAQEVADAMARARKAGRPSSRAERSGEEPVEPAAAPASD
ncbi:MAG: DNA topoisomerase I [Planctomycetota bacterium]|nr:MAG: DNA topoisomerase I [Planctomycetota bacterium]